MSWIKQSPPGIKTTQKIEIPDGLWHQCHGKACGQSIAMHQFEANHHVCPYCQHHHYYPARKRLDQWFDQGYEEIGETIQSSNRLAFHDTKDYDARIQTATQKSGETEAVVSGFGRIGGLQVVASVFEFQYIGGSMSSGVGDRILAAIDVAISKKVPFICAQSSGGARMQEGVHSLMQMARLSSALTELAEAKLPYVSVLLHPTSGGVAASIAMLGDVIIAEPNALIGFAGPRVIKQTVGEDLPKGFQRSEMLLENGCIDAIVIRSEMKAYLSDVLTLITANK